MEDKRTLLSLTVTADKENVYSVEYEYTDPKEAGLALFYYMSDIVNADTMPEHTEADFVNIFVSVTENLKRHFPKFAAYIRRININNLKSDNDEPDH